MNKRLLIHLSAIIYSAIILSVLIFGPGVAKSKAAIADYLTVNFSTSSERNSIATFSRSLAEKKKGDITIIVGEPIITKDPPPAPPKK